MVNSFLRPSFPPGIFADQFAYKNTGSSTCALVALMHDITVILEHKRYVRCLLVDFSKAFDTVDHGVLLGKIAQLNVPPEVNDWIIDFLRGRSQRVVVGDRYSESLDIGMGVVQGSSLGPTLFSVMVSDLRPLSPNNNYYKFADDVTALSPEGSDISLEDEFQSIKRWAAANRMTINLDKTKEMVFTRPNARLDLPPPRIPGLELVTQAKVLGVTLAHNLKFDGHIRDILAACGRRRYLLKQLKAQGLSVQSLTCIFKAIIVSKILYAVAAWGGFVNSTQVGQITGFLRKSFRWGICSGELDFAELLEEVEFRLFRKVQDTNHCLHYLLPPPKPGTSSLRPRGHCFGLPVCKYDLQRSSFINRCLYNYI